MTFSLPSKIAIFWFIIMIIFGFIKTAPAAIPVQDRKTEIEFQGRSYQILKAPDLNLVKVTTDLKLGPVRDELILKVKRGNLPPNHIHLRLSSTTPEKMIYTGILPSRILWQGNLTFELSTGKSRR
jgi:hypothetical protein